MLCGKGSRAIPAISNAAAPVGNSHSTMVAGRQLGSTCVPFAENQTVLFLELRRVSSRKFWRTPKTWIERATGRDQVIAEWLNWLCDNGSVLGRC